MTCTAAAQSTIHRTQVRRRSTAVLAALAAAVALGDHLLAAAPSSAPHPVGVARHGHAARRDTRGTAPGDRALGEADGAVPDGTSVFDDRVPGVAKLNPALLAALRRAATAAANGGVDFVVDSGWRSAGYQEQLLQQAVLRYGSEQEALRWVASPDRSAHVSGDAVDIGPPAAASWLSAHGAEYGLCRVYGNEPWHFELRPAAANSGCPSMYADPTHDPRMQR